MAGKVYYVSGTGSDSNNGLKEGTAFRTLQKAANLVQAGDTVYVMNGTYEQSKYSTSSVLEINRKHGTQDAPITFKALAGHNPLIKSINHNAINILGSSYIVIEGLTMVGANDKITLEYAQAEAKSDTAKTNPLTNGNGIFIRPDNNKNSSHHITIRGNTVSKFPGGGISSNEADYLLIENNIVSETCWYSPWGTNAITTLNNRNIDNNTTDYKIIIRNNVSFDNYTYIPWWEVESGKATEGHGIMIDSSNSLGLDNEPYKGRTLIANNISYNNGGAGIQVFKSSNVDVINNTNYQNSNHPDLSGAGEILISGASENLNVVNNIMYAKLNGSSYVVGGSTKNVKADRNLIYNTNIYNKTGTNLILGKDPQFVNAAARNFALKSGSVAIDAGSSAFNNVTGRTPQDGDGNGTAVVDIGAYEAPTIKIPTPEIQVLNDTVDIADGTTTAINFGDAIAGNTLTKTFTIKNTGTAALNLTNLKLPDGFSLVGTLPTSVAANASTTITIGLNTTTPGTYGGTLILSNNDSNESAFDFAISGTVKPVPTPEIEVLNGTVDIADGMTTIDFGNTSVGNTLIETFTIQNIGTAALNLSNLELPDGFSLVGTLPTSVAVNTSTTISVALNTTTPGTYSGSFSLSNNDSNESPFDFAITGIVKPAPTPEIPVINGTNASEFLQGNAPANKIYGFGGADRIVANPGNDQVWGGEGYDTLWGGNGNDLLYGDSGNDYLWGNNDNDTLFGGIGNDTLNGRAGDDWLYGGKGNDVLTGDYGSDTFVLASGEGTDSIVDFKAGIDKIALSGGLQFGQLLIQQQGTQAFILDSSDNQVLAKLDNASASILLAQSSTNFMTI
ncbi:MAG: choice-of-anchor D domain-containing protein [Nostoc sp. DedQUE12a]|nr:choice-of-anchor D domain-containing protein [Nostoc sp. DedQUE12a]